MVVAVVESEYERCMLGTTGIRRSGGVTATSFRWVMVDYNDAIDDTPPGLTAKRKILPLLLLSLSNLPRPAVPNNDSCW